MAAPLAAGLVSSAGGLLSSVVNSFYDNYQQERQREFSREMYARQKADNIAMWNMQNEYDDPRNVVARMRAAGLNLLYHNPDGSSNAISPAQALGYERSSAPNGLQNFAQSGLQSYMDSRVKQAQIDNLNADTAKKGEETLTEVERRQKLLHETETEIQTLENMRSQKQYTDAQKRQIDKALDWYDRIQESALAESDSRKLFTDAQRNRLNQLLEGEKILQAKTIEEFEHRWDLWLAQATKDAALAGLTDLDIANYGINHMTNGLAGSGISLQNWIRNRFLNYDGSPKDPSEIGKTYEESVQIRRRKRREGFKDLKPDNSPDLPNYR